MKNYNTDSFLPLIIRYRSTERQNFLTHQLQEGEVNSSGCSEYRTLYLSLYIIISPRTYLFLPIGTLSVSNGVTLAGVLSSPHLQIVAPNATIRAEILRVMVAMERTEAMPRLERMEMNLQGKLVPIPVEVWTIACTSICPMAPLIASSGAKQVRRGSMPRKVY